MKKIFLALMCTCFLASCSLFDAAKYSAEISDGTDPSFDEYPGMNANTQPLEGEIFNWPETFTLNSVIVGEQNDSTQNEDATVTDDMYGSGLCVIVTLDLTNTQNKKDTLRLPAGLLVQATSSTYQNGILVKRVNIPFKANERRVVSVRFYCLNVAAHASNSEAQFAPLSLITNVPAFDPLFNVCAGKKLNINSYKGLNILSYYGACVTVQEIVWAITQGKTFKEKEIKKYLKHVKNS